MNDPQRAATPRAKTLMLPLPLRLSLVSLVFAAVVATVLTALGGFFLHRQQLDNATKSAQLAADELARRAGRLLALGLAMPDFIDFDAQCRAVVEHDPLLLRAAVFDAARTGWHASHEPRRLAWPTDARVQDEGPAGARVAGGAGQVFRPIRANGVALDGWAVVAIDPQAVLQSTLLRTGWLMAAGLVLFAAGLLIQQRVFWRTVGRPLATLVRAADSIHGPGGATLAGLPPADEADDIGRVHAALRRLVERLQAAQLQLQTHNERLEATVRERTVLLERANAELERDIRRRQELEEELRTMACTDTLTGLANRAFILPHVQRRIDAARREGRPLALMLLDFDRFKHINDTHGHAAGDEVLRSFAQRVQQVCRGSDVVARLGGDEFLVACEGFQTPAQVLQLAQRLAQLFDEPVAVGELRLTVGVSVGVALFPQHADDFDGVFAAADAAMYQAKQHGGGVAMAASPARAAADDGTAGAAQVTRRSASSSRTRGST